VSPVAARRISASPSSNETNRARLDAGGNLEVIQDGLTGLLVPPEDAGSLAAALLRLLEDEDLATLLAKAGREQVTSRFSFDRLVAETENLYLRQLQAAGHGYR